MKKHIFTFIFSLALPFFAHANEADNLTRAQNYLEGLHSFRANFEQFTPGEPASQGTFYLQKPGKFLWAYATPRTEKLVSTGLGVFFVEEEGGEVTQIPSHPALQKLLVGKNVSFDNEHIKVISVKENDNIFALEFELFDDNEPVGGAVLSFDKQPVQLSSLTTIDPAGSRVYVRFYNQVEGEQFNNKLFHVEKPFDF